MKKLLLILSILSSNCYAQQAAIDGLKQELSNAGSKPKGLVRDTLICYALKSIMRAYVDVDIDSSSHYNQLLIAQSEKPGLENYLIYAYQYAGYLYQVRGDYHQSIRYHYKALPLAEKMRQYTRTAASLGWLAHAYTSLTEFDKASKLCQQGLAVLRRHPDSYIESSILNVQGAIFRQQGELEQALEVNQKLYRLAQREQLTWYEAQGLHAIGWVYKEMKDMPKALDYFRKALSLARETGSADLEGSILLNISNLYSSQKRWTEALAYCQLAKETAKDVGDSSIEAEAFEALYKIFKQTGNPAKALNAYENYVLLRDSLSKEKTDHRIETLQAQYDNVQKTSELQKKQVELLANQKARKVLFIGIILILAVAGLLFWNNNGLQAKNKLINRQKAQLVTTQAELANINKTLESRVEERTLELVEANCELIRKNEEIKAALFKGQTIERKRVAIELHDNLSSLLSAVNMSIQHINPHHLSESEQSVYQNIKHLIQNAYAEVRNISHNILPAELEKEGLVRALASLVAKLNQNSPLQFSLMFAGLDQRLPAEIEFNVYSIVLELINNVIKHAKASAAGISIRRSSYGVDIAVTDNGIGLGENQVKKGIGLQNVETRLESLGGSLTATLSDGRGMRIAINIPIETESLNGNVFIA
ncbi:sensor histidine kinase [Dyadobacter chenwenxiniae]|uniref:histidine kinase n=1 Tax=Dyadobacter chenwenxiniae TaxID=2906456 RepID=A0A9X1PKQ3_9BACT|nr:tetratricopeptide repeat protein [Dyadobacter chenwenxiniae]MCF0060576.1 sensor histidine kinase [Dyadobacter chenwenxiniae]UON86307.1 sensor histidine kinase [Dyadobacter chenwenxiniae]